MLIEEANLAHPGVPVDHDGHVTGHEHAQVTDADRGLHVRGRATREVEVGEVEAKLADPEVVLVVEVAQHERLDPLLADATGEGDIDHRARRQETDQDEPERDQDEAASDPRADHERGADDDQPDGEDVRRVDGVARRNDEPDDAAPDEQQAESDRADPAPAARL